MGLFSRKEKQDRVTNYNFLSPLSGKLMDLSEVKDEVFSQKMMGDGFAIEIDDSVVVAPFDGEVTMVFPTGHAYGLKSDEGLEVLIHIGMDTVDLEGDGFISKVSVSDRVKKGDILAIVDLEVIKEKGKTLVSPVVFTSSQKVSLKDKKEVKALEEVVDFI